MTNNLAQNIRIRNISIEDAQDLKRINDAITHSSPDIDFQKLLREQIQKDAHETSFVAELDSKVVGFMISHVIYGGFGLEKSAWIAIFGVDPKHMGQGIGKKLAQALFQIYEQKGIKYIYTSVRWDSVDILSFFKTLGFQRSDFINLRKELNR